MDVPDLTDAQRALLATAYDGFRQVMEWPVFAWLDTRLDQDHALDAEEVLASMPSGLVTRDRGAGQRSSVRLTAAAMAYVDAAREDRGYFVRLVRWLAERERSHDPGSPTDPTPLEVGLDEVAAEAWEGIRPPGDVLNRVLVMLQTEGLATARTEHEDADGEQRERFVIEVNRHIRPYRDLADIEDYIQRRPQPPTSGEIFTTSNAWTGSPILFNTSTFAPTYLELTHAATSEPDVSGTYIFILMPFTPSWSENVKDLIDQSCARLQEKYEDLRWERADDMTTSGRITDQIITAIERADLVIADVTDSNPNVMFELGYAAALDRAIVLLNQSVTASPFDIKDWRQIVYSMDRLAEARNELVRHLDANLHRIRERAEA